MLNALLKAIFDSYIGNRCTYLKNGHLFHGEIAAIQFVQAEGDIFVKLVLAWNVAEGTKPKHRLFDNGVPRGEEWVEATTLEHTCKIGPEAETPCTFKMGRLTIAGQNGNDLTILHSLTDLVPKYASISWGRNRPRR